MPVVLAVPLLARPASRQTFFAGVVPAGRSSPGEVKDFWSHCDEVAGLGFHRVEVNNTRARIAEYYSDKISEFTDAMASRKLTLVGLAQFSRMATGGASQDVIDQHMLLGRFLAAVGGKYITHMIAPGPELNEAKDEAAYRQIDVSRWAANANAIGQSLSERWGIKLAYHPEQAEVRSGLYRRFLESTDERYVAFLPDTGHLASGGADVIKVFRTYRSRLACVHLKDFSPVPPDGGERKPGNVPLGEGKVNFPDAVAELRRTAFAGYVMGESGGTNQVMHDYMVHTLGITT